MVLLIILTNFVLAYFIGFLGRNRKLGFWGHFFASLLLTPVIGFLLIAATDPIKEEKPKPAKFKFIRENQSDK